MQGNTPVRERAIRALMEHLGRIQEINGFQFNVRHVRRRRHIPERAEDPVEIDLLFGETRIDEGYNNLQTKEYADIFIWFVFKETGNDDEDFQYNLFTANVQRAIGAFVVEDITQTDSGPVSRTVDIYQKKHLPRYAESRTGYIVGRFEIQIGYCYHDGQPDRWDSDDLGVPLEE